MAETGTKDRRHIHFDTIRPLHGEPNPYPSPPSSTDQRPLDWSPGSLPLSPQVTALTLSAVDAHA